MGTQYFLLQNKLKNQKFCPVGKLLPGVSVVIVDEAMQPQPVGIPGEVCFCFLISQNLIACSFYNVVLKTFCLLDN